MARNKKKKNYGVALLLYDLDHAMLYNRLDCLSQTKQEAAEHCAMVVMYMMWYSHSETLTCCKDIHQIFYITAASAIQAFLSCIKGTWGLIPQVGPPRWRIQRICGKTAVSNLAFSLSSKEISSFSNIYAATDRTA